MTGVAFDERSALVAAATLRGVAAELRGRAAGLAVRAGPCAWDGPARDAHERDADALAAELRAIAEALLEVADDAVAVTARARRLAEGRRDEARRAARLPVGRVGP